MKPFKQSALNGIALQGYQLNLDVDWKLYSHYKLLLPFHYNFFFTYADKGEGSANISFAKTS